MVNPSLADISLKKLNIDPNVNVSQKHIDQLFSGITPLLTKLQSSQINASPVEKSSCKYCKKSIVSKKLGAQYAVDPMFATICPSRGNFQQCEDAGGQWGPPPWKGSAVCAAEGGTGFIKDFFDSTGTRQLPVSACKAKCKSTNGCKFWSTRMGDYGGCMLFSSCGNPRSDGGYGAYNTYSIGEEGQMEANYKEGQAKQDVKKITKLLINNFDDKIDEVNEKIKSYKMQVIGHKHMADLKDRQGRDINQVQATIVGLKNKNNINNRLANYYNSQNNSYSQYIPYIKITYWVLLTIYSCYFIIYKQLIKNKKLAIITLALWILPFTLNSMLYWLFPKKIVTPPVSYTCPSTPPSAVVKPPPLPVIPTPSWKPPPPPPTADVCKPPTIMNALRNLF